MLSPGGRGLCLLLALLFVAAVEAQRRYSKFGVPQVYHRLRPGDDGIVFPGEASSSFQSQYDKTASGAADRFRLAAEALFSVAIRLQSLLDDPNSLTNGPRGNFLASPISVTAALGQLALGSRGESHRQLGELLSLPGRPGQQNRKRSVMQLHLQLGGLLEILQTDAFGPAREDFDLTTASALFIAPQLRVFPRFKREVNEMYNTQVITINFAGDPAGSQRRINNWVSQHTRGRIQRAVPYALPPSTAVLLSNAIYMKAAWKFPFSRQLTAPGVFRPTLNTQVPVQFMRGQFQLRYVDNPRLRLRVLHLPYKRSDVGFYVILPYDTKEEYDIHNLTAHLTVPEMLATLNAMRVETVTVALPKMTLMESFSLKEPLRRFQQQSREQSSGPQDVVGNRILTRDINRQDNGCTCTCVNDRNGVPKPVTLSALSLPPDSDRELVFNMTNASSDPRFRIQDIVHQMFFEVNEEGTEGAAATIGLINYSGGTKVFRVDRPFVFFVRHETTLATLFWATIVDPTNMARSLG